MVRVRDTVRPQVIRVRLFLVSPFGLLFDRPQKSDLLVVQNRKDEHHLFLLGQVVLNLNPF